MKGWEKTAFIWRIERALGFGFLYFNANRLIIFQILGLDSFLEIVYNYKQFI